MKQTLKKMAVKTKKANVNQAIQCFEDLFADSGWSQAETARQLMVSSNYVHMILKGKSVPSRALLELMEMKVKLALIADTANMLRQFPKAVREEVADAFRDIVSDYRQRIPKHSQPTQPRGTRSLHEPLLQRNLRSPSVGK